MKTVFLFNSEKTLNITRNAHKDKIVNLDNIMMKIASLNLFSGSNSVETISYDDEIHSVNMQEYMQIESEENYYYIQDMISEVNSGVTDERNEDDEPIRSDLTPYETALILEASISLRTNYKVKKNEVEEINFNKGETPNGWTEGFESYLWDHKL